MPKHNWKRARGWRSHSIACWDAEWAEYQKAAEAAGKSVNGWIRDGLKEIVRYERVASDGRSVMADRDDRQP